MNRIVIDCIAYVDRVPHARGDEPHISRDPAIIERVPHARGDEPSIEPLDVIRRIVFPTRVGMNRTL